MAIRIPQGKTVEIVREQPTDSGVNSKKVILEGDTILVSLVVTAMTGNVDVVVYTYCDEDSIDQKTPIITFPTITSPTTEILLRKGAASLDNIIVEVTYTGSCSYDIHAKSITSGELNARITGATDATITRKEITTTAIRLVSAALDDRSGFIIQNNNDLSGILYIGFSEDDVTTDIATKTWLVKPNGNIAMDIAGGVELWVKGSEAIDVSIIEGGG